MVMLQFFEKNKKKFSDFARASNFCVQVFEFMNHLKSIRSFRNVKFYATSTTTTKPHRNKSVAVIFSGCGKKFILDFFIFMFFYFNLF